MFTSELLCPPQHQCKSADGILSPWGWIRDAATTQCRYGWLYHGGKQGVGRGYWGPLADHRDAIGQSVTPVTYGMLIFDQQTGNLRHPVLMRRNAMTRASILFAAAAALLLGIAAVAPAAAEDAATSATRAAPATTPAPATAAPTKGEFDNSCAMGLAEGQTVKTDCSINWTAPDGKVYCFSRKSSKEAFLKNPTENIQKAREFFVAQGLAKDTASP